MSKCGSAMIAAASVLFLLLSNSQVSCDEYEACPAQCACLGNAVDCSKRTLTNIPEDIPSWTEVLDVSWNGISHLHVDEVLTGLDRLVEIDLSHNELSLINSEFFSRTTNLQQLKLSYNKLSSLHHLVTKTESVVSSNLSHLILSHNSITDVDGVGLSHVTPRLRVLDLGFNVLATVRNGSFSSLPSLHHLLLNDNRIELIDRGAFDNMTSLEVLKLNKNKLHNISPAVFTRLDKLHHLDLSGNRLRKIEGLRFQGLSSLTTLRLRRNTLVELMDGAFWGLSAIQTLQLDYNNLTRVHGGFLFGLETLQRLTLSHNKIAAVDVDSWPACKRLVQLDLSHNRLSAITDSTFAKLSSVVELRLSHNRISYITENAFRELTTLRLLELDHNEVSGILEDSVGVFTMLTSLTRLSLNSNKIKSIAKRAFDGLGSLRQLYLLDNDITGIQEYAFSSLNNLQEIRMNASNLLCDCHLSWLPVWLRATGFQLAVSARCGHPMATSGHSVLELTTEQFQCDDFPKPVITLQPVSQIALKDGSLTLTCQVVTSSESPLTVSWKKDHTVLSRSLSDNSQRRRADTEGGLMELTSTLRLWPVKADHAGLYQCIGSNMFGTAYSVRAAITISVFPRLVKTPSDLTVRAGTTARLECAAVGQPTPEVAWQKDGGYDFPAARERRMHVMPSDDVFFIVDVKTDDQGVYTCTAKNDAGSVRANATLTVIQAPSLVKSAREKLVREGDTVVLECMSQSTGSARTRVEWLKDGRRLSPTDSYRLHLAADSQLLVVTQAQSLDAGVYTCVASNSLGTERAVSKLTVISNGNKHGDFFNVGTDGSRPGDRHDVTMRVGLAIMAGVAGVVLTSFIWVVVIYCLRRRRGVSDTTSSTTSSTSDTIVVGAGTSSDLSFCASPVSSWMLDRNGQRKMKPGNNQLPVATQLYSADDVIIGCHCQDSGYCDDMAYHQHTPGRHLVSAPTTLPRTNLLQKKRHSLGGSSDLSERRCGSLADDKTINDIIVDESDQGDPVTSETCHMVVGSDSLSPSTDAINSSTRTERNHVTDASSLLPCESPRVDSPSTAPV